MQHSHADPLRLEFHHQWQHSMCLHACRSEISICQLPLRLAFQPKLLIQVVSNIWQDYIHWIASEGPAHDKLTTCININLRFESPHELMISFNLYNILQREQDLSRGQIRKIIFLVQNRRQQGASLSLSLSRRMVRFGYLVLDCSSNLVDYIIRNYIILTNDEYPVRICTLFFSLY